MFEEIQQIAVDNFQCFLKSCSKSNATYRQLLTVEIEDAATPLLLIGEAHGSVEDGYCIAILNPEESLLTEVKAGISYLTQDLLNKVTDRCDVMLKIWIEAYKNNRVNIIAKYEATLTRPARFLVK